MRPQTSNYHFGYATFLLSLIFGTVQAFNADKVKFQIFEIDSPLKDIMWCGNTNEVILVQSYSGTVYRSRDRGESWKKLHSQMHQTGSSVLEESQTDIGHVQKMIQSPVDDSLVVFTGTNGINWVTEDCGANLRALNSGKKIHEFTYHPKQRTWALAAGWTSCADFGDGEPCEIYKELYVTKDLGQSWQFIKSHVFDFAWGTTQFSSSLGYEAAKRNSESRIFITHDPDLKGHQKTRQRWKESVNLYYSDDFFKSQTLELKSGNSIVMTKHYMFVARAISEHQIEVHVSRAEEGFKQFNRARMPNNMHITDHFTVMDTSESQVFLYVSDHEINNPVGNLFISDGAGYKYSHSVQNIIKGTGAVDFETLESMDGTFVANRYDFAHGTLKKGEKLGGGIKKVTEEDVKREETKITSKMSGGRDSNMNKNQIASKLSISKSGVEEGELKDFDNKIKTYITHNKGSTWELVRAPQVDLKGSATNCFLEDHCSLHLQMYSHNPNHYAPPYSQESAVGVVMAVGNIGEKMEIDKGARKGTFLSRDGGVTWSEIAKVPLIYEFGDHGGLLVAAPNTASTREVRYSWNEGKTWQRLQVSDVPIYIENIIIEPKSTSQQFVIYGSYDNTTEDSNSDVSDQKGKNEYDQNSNVGNDVMVSIDFAGLHEPTCAGSDNPGTAKSDYELWSPHDDGRHGSSNKCFLGQQVTYVRRKQEAECYNGEQFERTTMRVPCLCTEADYECDINYVRNPSGQCEPIEDPQAHKDFFEINKVEDCHSIGFYEVTQGYRKIPGNKCYGGVQLDPVKKPCNGMAFLQSLGNAKGLGIIVLVIVALYYGWPFVEAILLMLPIPDPRESIDKVKNLAGGAAGMIGNVIPGQGGSAAPGYQQNLDSAPEAYLEGDDSDEETAKNINDKRPLSYDSDEKNDEELIGISTGEDNSNAGSELIDLGSQSSNEPVVAKKIPKLAGPN